MHTHTSMLTQQAHACWQTCNRCIWLLGEWVCCVFVCLQLERVCLCVWERVSVCVCSCCRMRNPLSHLPAKKYFTIHETNFFLASMPRRRVYGVSYVLSTEPLNLVPGIPAITAITAITVSPISLQLHHTWHSWQSCDSRQLSAQMPHHTRYNVYKVNN